MEHPHPPAASGGDTSAARGLLEDYRDWYREHWVPRLLDDGWDEEELQGHGWLDPLGGLSPVSEADVAALEARFGPLPADYRAFLRGIGAGTLPLPRGEALPGAALESLTLVLLHPARIPAAHASYTGWLHEAWSEVNEGVADLTRMMPILAEQGHVDFVLLSLQHPGDDRVHLWWHDEEPCPMDGGVPFTEFLRTTLARARHGRSPLSP